MRLPLKPSGDHCARPLRRDAQRNRDALLRAAGQVFAEQGLDASLEAVAKRAGVAIGTLYRHFPARLDLVHALFDEKLAAWSSAGEQALALPDAWAGFVLFVETLCELQAADLGFAELTGRCLPDSAEISGAQQQISDLGQRIVQRAQQQGALRADVTAQDLAFLVWSLGPIAHATRGIAPRAWRRHLYLMLDAFRAERAHPLPEAPLTPDQVHQAMLRRGGAQDCGSRAGGESGT